MKKIMAMLTALTIFAAALCQSAVFAAFDDVDESTQYRKAITTLTKLNVIAGYEEEGKTLFKPDNTITRAEFTKLIVFMLGYQDLAYSSINFDDVKPDFWAANYIQTAYNLGIISGMGNGNFEPDSPVTYEQALKMVVCTLGYEAFAQAQTQTTDSWSEKYIKQAGAINLTKNIAFTGNMYDGASRGVIAQLMYNALEVEMYENNGYNWEKTEKTLMNDYLKVKELKGTLIGVEDTITEECKNELYENEMAVMTNAGETVTIDYSEYTQNDSEISKYLGNTITVYYRQLNANDERKLVIIDDETTKNSQFEITYDNLNSFSGNTLKYYAENRKSETVKLKSADLTVRYNGKLVAAADTITLVNSDTNEESEFTRQEALEKWLTAGSGYTIYGDVKLTDNGSDGTVDMIQINDYDVMVAYAAPNTSDYRITDKLVTGNFLILDPQAADYTYTITKGDTEIPITSISANDVILYAKSLDESLYSLFVSKESVKGSITSINSNGTQMTIAGKSYNIGDKCASYIQEKDGKTLKVGVSGTFYLDALGTAVFGTLEQTAAAPYAYITNAFIDRDEGGKAYITMYSANMTGGASSYQLKDKIKFNGSSMRSELVVDKLSETAAYSNDDEDFADKIYGAGKTPSLTGYSQPARVMIKDNIVTEIITLESDEVQTQNDDKEKIVRCKDLEQYTYSSNSFTQNGKTAFSVNSSTVVLYIPGDRAKRDEYAKKTVSSAFTTGDSYYVEAYDISSSKTAGLVILYGNDGSLTPVKKDTNFSVVSTLPESVYNEDTDDNSLQFEVFSGTNMPKAWKTYDSDEFADVQVGDVIQFAYDSDQLAQGRVNNIKFADIAEVLDGAVYNDQLFNWQEEQEPSEENNYQEFKFDYRFKKAGTSDDEIYNSSSLGSVPYSRACMYNVSQVLTDEKKIYVTQGGFSLSEDGSQVIDDSSYEEISITSSTKILRMEEDREEISRYAADTTTDMSINDLKDAKNYGTGCSKVLVCSSRGAAKLIVVYN